MLEYNSKIRSPRSRKSEMSQGQVLFLRWMKIFLSRREALWTTTKRYLLSIGCVLLSSSISSAGNEFRLGVLSKAIISNNKISATESSCVLKIRIDYSAFCPDVSSKYVLTQKDINIYLNETTKRVIVKKSTRSADDLVLNIQYKNSIFRDIVDENLSIVNEMNAQKSLPQSKVYELISLKSKMFFERAGIKSNVSEKFCNGETVTRIPLVTEMFFTFDSNTEEELRQELSELYNSC